MCTKGMSEYWVNEKGRGRAMRHRASAFKQGTGIFIMRQCAASVMHHPLSSQTWPIFLFGVFCPTQEFFTHLETSPLPLKGCKFLPMLGTYGH